MDENVSLRRVAVALNALPMGSWPETDHGASWTVTDYLLCNVIDEIRTLTWLMARVNGAKRAKRPEPVYRPGTRKPAVESTGRRSWIDFARALMKDVGRG